MKTISFSCAALVAVTVVWGAEPPAAEVKFEPIDDRAPKSVLFPEIQAEARRINRLVADAIAVPTRQTVTEGFPRDAVAAFGQLVRQDALTKLGGAPFPSLGEQLDYFSRTLATGDKYPAALPTLTLMPKPTAPLRAYVYFFTGNDANEGEIPMTSDDAITVVTSAGTLEPKRSEAIQGLADAIGPYQRNANAFTAFNTREKLTQLADDWDAYFDKARPQTFWDIAFTTLVEQRHFRQPYLVGPPDRQWFVLRPNAVVENLSAAPKGDQLGGAAAIEWVGVNWWRGFGGVKFPVGISITSLYSDRRNVSHVGHGVTLYLANRYCIGWASHGGDNGFYVSVDTLQFIDNKRTKLDQYRSSVQKYLGKLK